MRTGLEDRRARSSGSVTRSRSTSAARRDGMLDHRPHSFDELEGDAHAEDGRHDVGEHDGRVDAVTAHGLQRHLGAELRRAGDVEEPVPLADRAVLGQRAARPGA